MAALPLQPKISHAALLTGAQLSRGLSRLILVLVVARELGPQQFGVYALLLAMTEILAVTSGSGYADYLTREAARDARVGWGLGSQLILLRLVSVIPVVAVGLGLLRALGYPNTVLASAALLSVSLLPRSVSELVQGVLRGVGSCLAYFVVEVTFGATLLGGAAWLLVLGTSLRAAIIVEITAAAAAGIAAVVFAILIRTKERFGISKAQLLRKSIVFNLYYFIVNLYDRVDILLLSKLAGDYATGVYSAAYRPLAAIQLVPYGVLYSILPGLSRNASGKEELRRLEKAMGLLLNVALVVVLATMVYAGPAVRRLLGGRYAESAVALKILIWAVILRYVNYVLNIKLLAAGLEKVFVVTSLTCLAVNVVANVALIPKLSWRAAAIITIATEAVLLAQNVYWLRRATGGVPKPAGWLRTSIVFASLVVLSIVGAKIIPPLYVGTGCILLFLMYLYQTGMIGEFAETWGTRDRSALEGSNP